MITEANDPYNKKYENIIKGIYSLEKIQFQKTSFKNKANKAFPIIYNIYLELLKNKNFLLLRTLWENLHDKMVFYYDFLNEENMKMDIPLFRTTLHNGAVKWWLKLQKEGRLCGTLIHFDTHDDMDLPENTKGLLRNGEVDYEGIDKGSCGQIDWPITCLLFAKQTDNVVWAMPRWVYDDDYSSIQYLTCKGNECQYKRDLDSPKDKFILPGNLKYEDLKKNKYNFIQEFNFTRLHIDSANGWKKLLKILDHKHFILDIDLDFFASNGNKTSLNTYRKNFTDLESDGRVNGTPGIRSPRRVNEDEESQKIIKKLNKEAQLIKNRINIFLNGLKMFRDKGYEPCSINISDSCTSLFSHNLENAVFTNEYTPKYFVVYMHMLILDGLKKIYGNDRFI